MVTTLLKHDADAEEPGPERLTPLEIALLYSTDDDMSILDSLTEGGACVDPADLFHFAADRCNEDLLRIVLHRFKADIDSKDSLGGAPLHYLYHDIEFAQTFLELGADVNLKDDWNGFTSLHCIADRGGDEELAELLLEWYADVNATDKNGCTALHVAVKRGRRSLAQLLLAHGADVDARDFDRQTPLYFATKLDHADITEDLLRQSRRPLKRLCIS